MHLPFEREGYIADAKAKKLRALRGGKETGRGPKRRGNSRLRYIFRTVLNAVVTRRCHRAWYFKLLLDPRHAPVLRKVLPLPRHSETNRRSSTAHVVPSRFSSRCSIDVGLFFFPLFGISLAHPYAAAPSFPSLLPYPLLAQSTRARAIPSLSLSLGLFGLASLLSLSLASLVPSWPLLRHLATASRTPFPLHVRSTPAFLPRRRSSAGASPSRITPRPRERSVTTKVLVKS